MSDAGIGDDNGKESDVGLGGASLSDALDALACENRRYALHYFQTRKDDLATVEDLTDYILAHDCEADDSRHVRIALHHQDLPNLDDAGLIDYDARSNTVRYRGDSTTEGLLDYLCDSE